MVELGVYTIDELGRVVLPKDFRQTHGWKEKTKVAVYQDGDAIVIKLAGSYADPGQDE